MIAPDTDAHSQYSQFQGTAFGGVLDGNGRIIENLQIQGADYLGLFGRIGVGAAIRNLGLEAVDVNGTSSRVGGLAGWNDGSITASYSTGRVNGDGGLVGSNYGTITASYSTGRVNGGGGLVGSNYGTITASYSTATVNGNGGLVGYNFYGSITTSYSSGTVSGDDYVGGLVGDNKHGSISASYSTARVSGDRYVGGLVGLNWPGSSITASYSTGSITGNDEAGGLVGNNVGSIVASYSTARVSGDRYVGGLVGHHSGSIATSYSTGVVTGYSWVGGLVGIDYWGSITSSFWDRETSGQSSSDGGTGLTTAEMRHISLYLDAGWDFVDEVSNGTCDYWQMSLGDYPTLRSQVHDSPAMPDGLGTAAQPYLIRDARDLGTVWHEPIAHYRLEGSLDLSGISWSMAVIPWFGGTFDGNGHTISHLIIAGESHLGLFGELGSEAAVSRLGLEEVDVDGTGDYIGGLVGSGGGSITNCHSTGSITGNDEVGGLVGESSGTVAICLSAATVTGQDHVGGLVGSNDGSIAACYSTALVSGRWAVGGLVGGNYGGSVTTSYSTGGVSGNGTHDVGGLVGLNIDYWRRQGGVTDSFWDTQSSGTTDSDGGEGKVTAEMQTASTFLDAGWDFVDETENGTEDIWWILEGQDYPRLWWERGDEMPLQIK